MYPACPDMEPELYEGQCKKAAWLLDKESRGQLQLLPVLLRPAQRGRTNLIAFGLSPSHSLQPYSSTGRTRASHCLVMVCGRKPLEPPPWYGKNKL